MQEKYELLRAGDARPRDVNAASIAGNLLVCDALDRRMLHTRFSTLVAAHVLQCVWPALQCRLFVCIHEALPVLRSRADDAPFVYLMTLSLMVRQFDRPVLLLTHGLTACWPGVTRQLRAQQQGQQVLTVRLYSTSAYREGAHLRRRNQAIVNSVYNHSGDPMIRMGSALSSIFASMLSASSRGGAVEGLLRAGPVQRRRCPALPALTPQRVEFTC